MINLQHIQNRALRRGSLIGVLLFGIFLNGCATVSELSGTQVHFDVANGYYESLRVNTWDMGDEFCPKIILSRPYSGDNWLPLAGVSFDGEIEETFVKVELVGTDGGKANLVVRHKPGQDSEVEKVILRQKIAYGEVVSLNLQIVSGRYIKVVGKEIAELIPIGFVPASMSLVTSSAVASMSIDSNNCEESIYSSKSPLSAFDFNRNDVLEAEELDKWQRYWKNDEIPAEFFDLNKDGVTSDEEIKAVFDELLKTPGVTIEKIDN